MTWLPIISLVASILCPIITSLVMWGYRSDQKAMTAVMQQLAKDNATTDKKVEDLRADFNDLKSDLPFVYTLREDFIRSLNNVDKQMGDISGKLDKLLDKK